MLLYPFPVLVTHFLRTFIVKGNANNNGRNPPLIIPFPIKAFINEEATGTINEQAVYTINEVAIAIGAIIGRNPLSCFLISFFTVSLAISRHEFSSGSTILLISSMSSLEIIK